MACCEVLFGTVPPTAPPSEAQIPLYIDRTSKKVYYWNGTGWELTWEIKTAGVGTPGVVSIDPNSPIYVGEGGTLQINCERLKTQCGFATSQEVSAAVSSAINELVKSLNTTLQEMNSRITSLDSKVSQVENALGSLAGQVGALGSLAGRVSAIEAWDLCAKTSSCGYSTGDGFSQSFGPFGYQKLPSGLIIQWGPTGAVSSASAAVTIPFPIAFPTACRAIAFGPNVTHGVMVGAESIAAANFAYSAFAPGGGRIAGMGTWFIAIGN